MKLHRQWSTSYTDSGAQATQTVEYKLHRTVEYKLHRQWSTSYTDSGVQATQTVEYKLHRQWSTSYTDSGAQATQTVEYKLHRQWSTSYTEQWSTSYTDSGVQATQTVEYKLHRQWSTSYTDSGVQRQHTDVFGLHSGCFEDSRFSIASSLLPSKTESRKTAHIRTCSEVHNLFTIHHTNMLRHNTMGLEVNSNRLTGVRPC